MTENNYNFSDSATLTRILALIDRNRGKADYLTITDINNEIEKYHLQQERSISEELFQWIETSMGWFRITDCYRELHILAQRDKASIRVYLSRLVDKGTLERDPKRNGYYRRVNKECEIIEWENAPTKDVPLVYPFGIQDFFATYPGNVIVLAGSPNVGKTAFCLNFIALNMNDYEVHYFNSEMGATEMRKRLELFQDVEEWNFVAKERNSNFADVVVPDAVNVIDYMEIYDEFYKLGGWINQVAEKLKNGIALIAVQKNYGKTVARGGEATLDKPRLYLSMDNGILRIIKCKNRKSEANPNGMFHQFKLVNGCDFKPQGTWQVEYE